MKYAIDVKNLSKEFRIRDKAGKKEKVQDKFCIFKDADFKVAEGSVRGLIGANGAGKTTLLKTLATLLLPSSGDAFVNGCSILSDPEKARRHMGIVLSGDRSFYFRLTGRQNLQFFGALYDLPGKILRCRIKDIAKRLDMESYLDTPFYTYSTGMKKKLYLARIFITDAKVLLLDEPLKGLDTVSRAEVSKFIKEDLVSDQGRSVLFTTHIYEEAISLSDSFIQIDNAEIKPLNEPGLLKFRGKDD